MRIAIAGTGRMGQAIAAVLASQPDATLAGHWARGEDIAALLQTADVIVDFTLPEATATIANACAASARPLVCGVTGIDADGLDALNNAARRVPVVYDRNMSIGIAVLARMLPEVTAWLGPGFKVSIHETHHVHKKDAPSGTALKLGEAVSGDSAGPDIDYHSERRGEVPGDHEVRFESPAETLTLAHSVVEREVFAEGAVRAARWALDRAPGLYDMQDVLSGD